MDNSKKNLVGVAAYITWIGFIIAVVLGDRTDKFITHHLNQALVINLLGIVGGVLVVVPLIGQIAAGIISAAVIVFDVIGALRAFRGSTRPLPFIGGIHLIG